MREYSRRSWESSGDPASRGRPMDRRRFLIGTAASATGIRARGFSLACDHHHQRVSARRRQRYRDATAGHGHGADPQAAGRGRDQGRRRRTGRRPVSRRRQARRLYVAVAQHRHLEVDKLFGRAPKVTRADFIPLARLVAEPILLLVNDQQTYKTLNEFIAAAKAHPDSLVFSSGGLYGASHLPLAYLEKATGPLRLRHLPTNGGGPAIVAILGNNAQVTTQSVSATLPHIKAGKLRPLAVFSATRSKSLPDVPTLKELGFDVEYYLWVGIFAPKGTPGEIVATLRAAIGKAVQSDQFKTALANAGQELGYLDGPDFQKFWDIDGQRTDEAVISIGRQG